VRKPIVLRQDYDAGSAAPDCPESEQADQVRPLLAVAVIYDGGSRTQAAEGQRRDAASGGPTRIALMG
jgi:hypothetical protein